MLNEIDSGNLFSAKQTSEKLGISRATLSRIKSEVGFNQIGVKIKIRQENVENPLTNVESLPAVNEQLQNKSATNQQMYSLFWLVAVFI